eukprot:EG_transcript_7229
MSPAQVSSQLLASDMFSCDLDADLLSSCTIQSLGHSTGSTLVEDVQRSHFGAFFMAHHAIRRPLLPKASLTCTMQVLVDGLRKMGDRAPWLRLQLHLRVRRTLRKRARRQALAGAHRTETLASWLAYWEAEEGRLQQGFRQRLQSTVALQDVLREYRGALARATTPVADPLKVQVVWELYWVLRAQYTHSMKLHWQRLQGLLTYRRDLLQRRALGLLSYDGVDFWHEEPRSLPAVTAAIFVLSLQEPKFQYAAGQNIRATELLRLANANLADGSWAGAADSPRGPQGCPTLLAFLNSPLLTEPQWLKWRSRQAAPVVPRCTWAPRGPPPDSPRSSGPASARSAGAGGSRGRRGSSHPPTPLLGRTSRPLRRPSLMRSNIKDPDTDPPLTHRQVTGRRLSSPFAVPPRFVSASSGSSGSDDSQSPETSPRSPWLPAWRLGLADPVQRQRFSSLTPARLRRQGSGRLAGKPTLARTPLSAGFEQVFPAPPVEVTAIYPKLPATLPLPSRDPSSPTILPNLRRLPSSGAKCSLPSIPQHC